MRRLFLALSLILAATSAGAAAPAKKEGAVEAQYIDLANAALPVIAEGRLRNYVFVMVRVNLSPTADAAKMREKEPFLRDAMVRAAHATPFTVPGDLTRLDEAKLKAAVRRDAVRLLGPVVTTVAVTSQTPQRRTGLTPRAPAKH
jgi:hypothetical protein